MVKYSYNKFYKASSQSSILEGGNGTHHFQNANEIYFEETFRGFPECMGENEGRVHSKQFLPG